MVVPPQNFLQPKPFFIDFLDARLQGDVWLQPDKPDDVPALLLLHDVPSVQNITIFNALRQRLSQQFHLSSCSFDFIGHGQTGGDWARTNLQVRTQQALEVVDAWFDCQAFNVVALGGSAYTALKMLPNCPIANLILIDPILYAPANYTVTFDKLFAQKLPQQVTHLPDSDILDAVSSVPGKLCLINSAQDEQAVPAVAALWDQQPLQPHQYQLVKINGYPHSSAQADTHTLMAWADKQPVTLETIALGIAKACLFE